MTTTPPTEDGGGADALLSFDSPILTTEQVAAMLSLNRGWFDRARKGGYGPPFMQVTSRIVRYNKLTVLEWFAKHTTPQA